MISIEGLSPYMAGSLEQVTLNRPFQTPTCSRLQALGNKRKDDNSGTDNSGLDKNIAKSKGLAIRGSEAWNAHLKQVCSRLRRAQSTRVRQALDHTLRPSQSQCLQSQVKSSRQTVKRSSK